MQTLFTEDGHNREVEVDTIAKLLVSHQTFWLDIQAPDDDDYKLLTDVFARHLGTKAARGPGTPAAASP